MIEQVQGNASNLDKRRFEVVRSEEGVRDQHELALELEPEGERVVDWDAVALDSTSAERRIGERDVVDSERFAEHRSAFE